MSSKSTILQTEDNEHWYFDHADYSKSGKHFDAYLELDKNVKEVMVDSKTKDIHITLCGELEQIYGKAEIILPKEIVKWWQWDADSGMIIQVDGDSDFALNLYNLTK